MEEQYTLPEDNPKKMYFSIKEVSTFIGVEQSNLRYWEKEFADKLKTRRDSKNRRQYTAKDVKTLRTIYHLLRVKGLSIEAARERLKDKKNDEERLQIVYEKLKKIKEELRSLRNALTLPGDVDEEEVRENVFNIESLNVREDTVEETEEKKEESTVTKEEKATTEEAKGEEEEEGEWIIEEEEEAVAETAEEPAEKEEETPDAGRVIPTLFSEPEYAPKNLMPEAASAAKEEEKEEKTKDESTEPGQPTPENDPRQLSLF
ncbi:MAG: MerR family transcriptional regulator [Paludibacteraceae bacterium]|nr:MerR family transcriptional regulator [Paludibacteraceae bacterium]